MAKKKNKELLSKKARFVTIFMTYGILVLTCIAFLIPLISNAAQSLSPLDLILMFEPDTTEGGLLASLNISFYVYKYLSLLLLIIVFVCLLITVLNTFRTDTGLIDRTNAICTTLTIIMLVLGLSGLNYASGMTAQGTDTSSSMITMFVIGLIATFIKFLLSMFLNDKVNKDELKNAATSMSLTFFQAILAAACLAFPLYILPGTKHRVFGFNIITGSDDPVSKAVDVSTYSTIFMGFVALSLVVILVSLILYSFKRKAFVKIYRFFNILTLSCIISYALMGLNFLFMYLEKGLFLTLDGFSTSLDTYAYIPLVLLIVFRLGLKVSRTASSKLNVQYKVYASTNDIGNADEEEDEDEDGERKVKKGDDPAPAFSELDRKAAQFNAEYEARLEYQFPEVTLPKLVEHIIEYAKYSREHLSYGPVEIKTFLAGLAASRLSILQGMSGTGKTSLPKIFCESIDGFCEIVAIESSWRDKNELLGYYNEFNKKYTPKTFTQYLYKATLNREIPTLIVLDEMNLSRIEYYFSDFLSLMEARENLRNIKLVDVQLYPTGDERKEYLGLRDGHTIDIPTNVWFIGTANRDESTFEISDKVYDRAQTMNFDKRAPKVNITEEKTIPKLFVPYSELRRMFDESKEIAFNAEEYDVIQKVEKILKPYKISFGNRVLKQIEEFVNAYLACGEWNNPADRAKFTLEAVDCILFSKVVRKLELKQINDIDTLIEDFTALNLAKSVEFLQMMAQSSF